MKSTKYHLATSTSSRGVAGMQVDLVPNTAEYRREWSYLRRAVVVIDLRGLLTLRCVCPGRTINQSINRFSGGGLSRNTYLDRHRHDLHDP